MKRYSSGPTGMQENEIGSWVEYEEVLKVHLGKISAAEVEALEWAKELFEDSLNLHTPERRWYYFRSRMDAEIERRKNL